MSKAVKKTYGKKTGWETEGSRAFDEAKLQSVKNKQSPSKIARPSIWAKVPLIDSLSPQRTKKKIGPALSHSPVPSSSSSDEEKKNGKNKQRKRKNEDPFGFGDLDDDLIPASEYISPKKKKKNEENQFDSSPSKTNKGKGRKSKEDKIEADKNMTKKTNGNKKVAKSPSPKSPMKTNILQTKASAKLKNQSSPGKRQKNELKKSPKKDLSPGKKGTKPKSQNVRISKKLSDDLVSPKKDAKNQKKGKAGRPSSQKGPEKSPVKSNIAKNVSPKKRLLKTESKSNSTSPSKKMKQAIEKSPVAKELFAKMQADEMSKTNEQPVVKRKRGRPRKHPLKVSTEIDNESNSRQSSQEQSAVENLSQETHVISSSNSENTPQTEGTLLESETLVLLESSQRITASEDDTESGTQTSCIDSASTASGTASGSPFKWFLKNNEKTLSPRKVAQLRRISVLPTCTPTKDDVADEVEDDAVPFGLSWAMQNDDNALRVNKEEKELFTIVRNTKQAQESVEFGESQQFKDDIDYLLDGIEKTNSLSTRCLSLLELASKCSKAAFRMHLRAHGTISLIFQKLNDAPTNQSLALCTASVMFMLTRDRLSIDFDKSILEMMLKLLAIEEDEETCKSKEWKRFTCKLQSLFEKNKIQGIKNLDLSKLTSASLARESFLSLTLQRTGSWFKEEIRLLGGLDHIVDTVISCSKNLLNNGKEIKLESNANARQIERCLKLLENVTVHCVTNQGYLIAYRNSALLESCARLLKYCVNCLSNNNEADDRDEIAALWFSAMKILLNLTHDNENASTKFCQQTDVLNVLLRSALQLPQFLPDPKQFDVIVLSLGLLINLVEYSKKNISALNAAVAPSCHESSQNADEAPDGSEDHLAVDSLLQLFFVRLEAAKDNNGMEEDLSKLNNSLHNSSLRIGPDGLSLICGDDLENTQNDEDKNSSKRESLESASDEKTAAEREAEHLGKALQRAGKHMEDSLIASYAALLIALLAEDNQENQQNIHEKLVDGDFGIMQHTLDKFLAFMNMTTNPNNSSSAQVIKRAIEVLEQCKLNFPIRARLQSDNPTEHKT